MDNTVLSRIPDHLKWLGLQDEIDSAPADAARAVETPPPPAPVDLFAAVHRLWPEPPAGFAAGLYRVLLGREPSADEVVAVVARLAAGVAKADLVREVAGSAEASARGLDTSWVHFLYGLHPAGVWNELTLLWPRPAAEFVDVLYRRLLHRPPDPTELARDLAALSAVGRVALVRGLLETEEFRAGGMEAPWADRLPLLTADGVRGRLRELRDRPDADFVRGLYDAVLFREPREDEAERAARALAAGGPRSEVVRTCLASAEPPGRCAGGEWADVPREADAPVPEASLLAVGEPGEFVRRAYREVLDREPTPTEQAREVRRLRFLPFFTRETLLRRLAARWEARRVADERLVRRVTAHLDTTLAGVRQAVEVAAERTRRAHDDGLRELRREQQAARAHADARADALAAAVTDVRGAVNAAAEGLRRAYDAGLREQRHEQQREHETTRTRADARADALAAALAGVRQALDAVVREEAGALRGRAAEIDRALAGLAAVVDAVSIGGRHMLAGQQAIRAEQLAYHAADELRFQQLRRLAAITVEHLAPRPEPVAPPESHSADACRVCGGGLAFRFRKRVLRDRYEAEYHECRNCGALQVPNPHWLPEAYAGEDAPHLWTPDPGRFRRNYTVYCYLRALLAAGLVGGRRVLDYGGGYGLLTQMLVDSGIDAWAADQYVSRTYFAQDRLIQDPAAIPDGSFDLVTASEVFEHLTDPATVGREFRRVLNPAGAAVLTTELYDPATHGPDWPYLASEFGQHVLFWTRAALRVFADRHGFQSVGYFPDGRFPAVVLAAAPAEELAAALDRAGRVLRDPAEAADAARVWQLFHASGPHARPLAEAEPTGGGT